MLKVIQGDGRSRSMTRRYLDQVVCLFLIGPSLCYYYITITTVVHGASVHVIDIPKTDI